MRALAMALSTALAAGCATEVVSTHEAKPAPPDRVLLKEVATPFPGSGSIIVKRDKGLYGSGCSHYVLLDGNRVAVLDQGEKVILFVSG